MSDIDFEARHRECAESLGAYALGALPEAEARDVELHLHSCERCSEELVALRLPVDALPAVAPPLTAPPELKPRIMSVVGAEAALLHAAGPAADRPPPPRPSGRPRWATRPVLAAAGAAALFAAAGAGFLIGGGASGGPSARTVQARVLPGSAQSAGTRASLRVHGDRGTLVVRDFPPPPAQRVYEIWVQRRRSSPVPAGARFAIRSGAIEIPHSLAGVDAVMVTAEPVDRRATPTGSPVLVARPA